MIPESGSFAVVANRLDLSEEDLLAQSSQGAGDAGNRAGRGARGRSKKTIEGLTGEQVVRFANFSVEMETGTGKDLRLSAHRAGTVSALRAAEVHHRRAVGGGQRGGAEDASGDGANTWRASTTIRPIRYYVYDSSKLAQVRQFALSDGVEMMVMTIDSFNKAANVIRQYADGMQGERRST